MSTRRNFLKISALTGALLTTRPGKALPLLANPKFPPATAPRKPIVISTWNHGMPANQAAWKILQASGTALDAVEAGVRVPEADPASQSVGFGGLPDREGNVTLDACIQDHTSNCGAVSFLQHIKHPISVARKVMEQTPHVMLSGQGALDFALAQGFQKENLLTPEAEAAWRKWQQEQKAKDINWENHDTIGMLALDANGQLAGACTTSGAAWKLHGRVGDSPIIGAGLFVDGDVGAACATGLGEAVIRTAGSAMVVEQMRHGLSPQEACKTVVERIISKHTDLTGLQVGLLALDKNGACGAYSVYNGFNYAQTYLQTHQLVDAAYDRTWD